MRMRLVLLVLPCLPALCPAQRDGNRLTYLDGSDPYYVSLDHPKLITPQWVGKAGVEAVVTLAIDDMNKPSPWVPFLKPTIARLEKLYGIASLSIMTTKLDPKLSDWSVLLAKGISIECHTYDHPCPILKGRDFPKAKSTYDRCIDLMHQVSGNAPVAFRVPCCDSLNTPSPRFFAEIFNKTTAEGHFLSIDSSVFNLLTPDDPDLPRHLVVDEDGREKVRKYIPFHSFVNTIENYPYPFVIGRLCWEFPCVTPSDWSAQNLNKPRSPRSFADLKASLDAVVLKQGTYNFVFHPYGWSHHNQIVELVDHAFARHGKKVLFLSFKQCLDRLNKHLLAGQPLRAKDGSDNGVRLLDLNNDGFLDVVIGNDQKRLTRVWSPRDKRWIDGEFPVQIVDANGLTGVRFGVVRPDGNASLLVRNGKTSGAWDFDGARWRRTDELLQGLEFDGVPILTSRNGRDQGVRMRDLDMDGRCELIVGNPTQRAVFRWDATAKRWSLRPFRLPALTRIVDAEGRDAGLRFVDVDEDGYDDVIFSDEQRYSLHLYRSEAEGWSTEVLSDVRGKPGDLPMISRSGTDNGAWFHSRHMWVQNEDTAQLANLVDRRSFNELLAAIEPTARTPAASMRSMQVRPGFRVELVAAEPLVRDPIAIAWGADARLWVVEMGGYPSGADGSPGGRIRFLEDTNADGRYDRSTVYVDGLNFPTGVLPWKDGVLVTCAPEILFFTDTDGDGKADRREVLFSGFGQGNQQHRVNGLRRGLDNWIYCANGDSGGMIKSTKTGKIVDIRGRDFRIRPELSLIDAQTGMTQFGRCRDDWGNWFGGNSGRTLWHCVLGDHYLRRNPHVVPPSPRVDVMSPAAFGPVFPISRALPRFNDPHTLNRFTSACGAGLYRDELFGENFTGAYFLCEPVHNLVHCGRMSADGVTFSGRRLPGGAKSELLAASDHWFRPVQVRTGPDGALWVVDMYRNVIEHPRWIPEDWQQRLDLRAGHDKGRIYRIFPVHETPRRIEKLTDFNTAGLIAALDSPNGPQRDITQQRIVELGGESAVPGLRRLAAQSRRDACRLQALCTLDGLGAATASVLQTALRDENPAVRRHAVRISESKLQTTPVLQMAVLALVDDPDPQVRLQLASSLGEWNDPRAGSALASIAVRDADDRFIVAAAMSSATDHLDAFVAEVNRRSEGRPSHVALMKNLMLMAVRVGNDGALVTGMRAIATRPGASYSGWQLDVLSGLLDTLGRLGRSIGDLRAKAKPGLRKAIDSLAPVFEHARESAMSAGTPIAARTRAIRLLARGVSDHDSDVGVLAGLLGRQSPGEVQLAAADALGRLDRKDVPERLLQGWDRHGPGLRARVLDVLLSRISWTEQLLDRLESKRVPHTSISARHRQRLVKHASKTVSGRSAVLFATAGNANRARVISRFKGAIELAGDRQRGATLFQGHCSICHRLGGLGYNVGPDLRALTDRSPTALLTAILDPNRAVEARYTTYTATAKDKRMFSGIIVNETGSSVSLIGPVGTRQTLLRADLEDLKSTGMSMMPEGYETLIDVQGFADLIAYVAQPHAVRKKFAGNVPVLAKPGADGKILLTATTAELYGPKIYYYAKPRVIGDWNRPEDRAVWSLELPRAGTYDVYLDWACSNHTAGNKYRIQVSTGHLVGEVAGTGKSWGNYKRQKVGRLQLTAGLQSLVVRSDGPIKVQALLDLRSIELVPVEK